MTHKKFVHQ